MANELGPLTIRQVKVWAYCGKLITEMTHEELMSAFGQLAEAYEQLVTVPVRPVPGVYVKDVG